MTQKPSIEQKTHDLLTQIEQSRPRPSSSGWVMVLGLIGVIAAAIWAAQTSPPTAPQASRQSMQIAPSLVNLPTRPGEPRRFVRVSIGTGGRDDLFLHSSNVVTQAINLTNSPAVDEKWPVSDATGEHIAYYGLSRSNIEVYLLYADSSHSPLPLTVRAGDSKLHTDYEITPTLTAAFSPAGNWVAFPAQAVNGYAVEVFIASIDGQQVIRGTRLNQPINDFVWLNDDALVVTYASISGTLQSEVYPLNSAGGNQTTLP